MKKIIGIKNQGLVIRKITRVWCIFCSLILVFYSLFPAVAVGYAPLKQSSWSGGYGQQVWSDSTKFNEYYHLKYGEELTIPGNDTWYDPAYKFRRRIEIDNSEQGELDHFPVLVVLEHKVNIDYLKAQSDDGYDLRFTDSDGTTVIPHDVERWDQGGKSHIWVKIPQIKDHQKDYFYMYYGNPDATDSRNPGQVFDNKYVMVQHLNEIRNSDGTYADATTAGVDGTYVNTNSEGKTGVEGKIANGINFTQGGDDKINLSTNLSKIEGKNTGSIQAWFKTANAPTAVTGGQTIFSLTQSSTSTNRLGLTVGNVTSNYSDESLGFTLVRNNTSQVNMFVRKGHFNYEDDRWHHVIVSTGNGDNTFYVDGEKQDVSFLSGSASSSEFSDIDSPDAMYIGRRKISNAESLFFEGIIDEVRISSVALSPDWARAEYKSQSNNYLSYGREELFGSALLSSIFDAEKGTSWGYLSYTADEPEKTAARVKVRTGNDMYLADAPDFEVCDSITNKSDISSNNCVTDGHRYIQYQVILDTEEANKTPIFKSISITDYLPHPVVKDISTQPQVTSHKEQENIKPKPTAQAGPRPSPSLIPNYYPLTPILDFLNSIFH